MVPESDFELLGAFILGNSMEGRRCSSLPAVSVSVPVNAATDGQALTNDRLNNPETPRVREASVNFFILNSLF